MQRGLNVIEGRSEALSRFMEAYSKLARLPPPRLQPVDVESWIERNVGHGNALERAHFRKVPPLSIPWRSRSA